MKLLQVIAGSRHGGAEEFFVRLASAIGYRSVEQKIIMRPNVVRKKKLELSGLSPIEMGFYNNWDLITKWRVSSIINTYKPDVVFTWMSRATKMIPLQYKGVHVGRLGGYYNLKYFRRCHYLVANTKDIADYLVANGWPARNIQYIPNFASTNEAFPVNRNTLNTPEGAKIILGAGRFHENKAFDVLLDALAQVPDVYLWLAGDGPLESALKIKSSELGVGERVRFLGWRTDIDALMLSADILVCPSRREPLGNIILEAWSRGLPVVAADSVGPRNLINNGKDGILFPVDNVELLSKSIKELISVPELCRKIGESGKLTYFDNFSEKVVVDQYIDFFREITN